MARSSSLSSPLKYLAFSLAIICLTNSLTASAAGFWAAVSRGNYYPENLPQFLSSSNQQAGQQMCDYYRGNSEPGSDCYGGAALLYEGDFNRAGTKVCHRYLVLGDPNTVLRASRCTFMVEFVGCPDPQGGLAAFDTFDNRCGCSDTNYSPVNDPTHGRVGCAPADKELGCSANNSQNPCNVATGNKFRSENDISTGSLSFTRYYNSRNLANSGLGRGWRNNHAKRLSVSGDSLILMSSTGRGEPWVKVNGAWQGDDDSRYLLTEHVDGFMVTNTNGAVDNYDTSHRLVSKIDTNGQQTLYQYDSEGYLAQLTNKRGASLSFSYEDGQLNTVTDHLGSVYGYEYDDNQNLTAVIFPDTTASDDTDNPRKLYHYENSAFPNHLTGITDENGDRYATFEYDLNGKAVMSELGTTSNPVGQEKVELEYQGGQ